MKDCPHTVTVTDCTGFKQCANVDCREVLSPSVRPNIWEIEPIVIHVELDDGNRPETPRSKP